jgi:hypothetical protein
LCDVTALTSCSPSTPPSTRGQVRVPVHGQGRGLSQQDKPVPAGEWLPDHNTGPSNLCNVDVAVHHWRVSHASPVSCGPPSLPASLSACRPRPC